MIIPSSSVGLDKTACLRDVILKRYSICYCSTYSIRPSKLFEGVDQRLCIILGYCGPGSNYSLFTTKYHHWHASERSTLFSTLLYVPSFIHGRLNRIVQIGDTRALDVFTHIEVKSDRELQSCYSHLQKGFKAHYHRSPRYWIRAMDFEQYFKSETRSQSIHHFRDLFFLSEDESKAICAIINSSLFFCWFLAVCNGRNLTAVDVGRFPIGHFDKLILKKLSILFDELMESYKKNSVITKRSDCEYQEFRPGLSKDIIDKIDEIASHHYGLQEEEQDFIINYEIKYRLGKSLSSRVQRKS